MRKIQKKKVKKREREKKVPRSRPSNLAPLLKVIYFGHFFFPLLPSLQIGGEEQGNKETVGPLLPALFTWPPVISS